jgi:hypothetical protein
VKVPERKPGQQLDDRSRVALGKAGRPPYRFSAGIGPESHRRWAVRLKPDLPQMRRDVGLEGIKTVLPNDDEEVAQDPKETAEQGQDGKGQSP